MNFHYPARYPINTLGSITCFLKLVGVLHSHTNTYKETNTFIGYSIINYHGSTLLEGYCSSSKLHNTPAIPFIDYLSQKYIGLHNLKHGGVLHSLSKTCKQNNTLFGLFKNHHGLNYFSLDYQGGIAYDKEYSMHMHYPLQGIP